jgi:hypothetical protein
MKQAVAGAARRIEFHSGVAFRHAHRRRSHQQTHCTRPIAIDIG